MKPKKRLNKEKAATDEPVEKSGVYVTDDSMQVLYTGKVPELLDDFVSTVESKLDELNIKSKQRLEEAASRIRENVSVNSDLKKFVLLEGLAPAPPVDGEIVWTRDFFKKGFVVDPETGRVDYRQPLAEATVLEGDLLAELHPPKEGEPGLNVFDNKIAADPPEPAVIRDGNNVRHDGARFYAKVAGLVRFAEGILSIDDLRVIHGSVGLATGNIDHPGALAVQENVDTDSVIRAAGDIEVAGYIEGADIKAGGDLTVNGGIMGEEGKTIVAEGNIQARFMRNAHIEAGGDVTVVGAIEQCTIHAGGMVRAQQGRIVGGETHAVVGVDAQEIGSEAYVRTVVVVGYTKDVIHRLDTWRKELEELGESVAKIEAALDSVSGQTESLDAKQRESIAALIHRADEDGFQWEHLKKKLKEVEEGAKSHKGIVARKRMYPSTSVSLGLVTGQVKEELTGPIRVAIVEGDIGFVKARIKND